MDVDMVVSHSEEQLESSHVRGNNELNHQEEDGPLVALAPDASLPQEHFTATTGVSACPLFQHLDELSSLGKISQTKVAKLKGIYKRLHGSLKSTQASEMQLLEQAKRRHAELQRLEVQVEGAEEQSTSEEPENEAIALRQRLLRAYNELRAAEDAEYATRHKLKRLWEEKRILVRESQNQLRRAEQESQTKALQEQNEALRLEVAQKQQEVRSLAEEVESREEQIAEWLREVEDRKKTIERKEAERAQLSSVPDQVLKDTEGKRSKRQAAMERMRELDAEVSGAERLAKEAEQRNHSLRSRREELGAELERLRDRAEACGGEGKRLLKELEVKREEEVELLGNRGILEMKLQSIMGDRKHLHERQCGQQQEINRQTQNLKRMEHVLSAAAEQLRHTHSVHDRLKAQLDAAPRAEAGAEQRMELQREVAALRVGFEKQLLDPLERNQQQQQQQQQQHGTIQGLLRESNSLREELHDLGCLRQIKAEERAKKHRELLRAQQLKQRIEQEVLEKDLIIADHSKLHAGLQRRLSQYGTLCHMLVEERDKYVELKRATSQSIAELVAKAELLENETEIQRNAAINKDRLLKKVRMKIYGSSATRERLRNDISKVAWKRRQVSEDLEDIKLESERLAQMIKLQEEASLELQKNLGEAVKRRNFLCVKLVEREREVLRCHEELSAREAAVAERNAALEVAEKELRDLQAEVGEEKRLIWLREREVPLRNRLEGDITSLQIELAEARDRALQRVSRAAEYKELKGKDPSKEELLGKIQQLETSLAERERQVLERELLAEQVTRLSKPLGEQVDRRQRDGLSLAKKVNELRAQIVDTNLRLTAASALLLAKQAAASSLQHEIKEKELQMEACQRQAELGLPPCPQLGEEWRRAQRDQRRRRRDREERERLAEEDEWNQLPNGEFTTAEPRPGAYLPLTDPLPLPRPYGALAPFKPSQPGANMRHMRKPSLRSLDE